MNDFDPRITPANERVAHTSLIGLVPAKKFVEGRAMVVQQPVANISQEPQGNRASQLLFGETFLVLETVDGMTFGQAMRDGQCGYIPERALSNLVEPTHWVVAPATHLYPQAKLKAPADVSIFFGSRVAVTHEGKDYCRIHTGHHIPRGHLMKTTSRFSDSVGVADLFLGTPYLWGGTSRWGIDCSGLIQAAMLACGVPCPRDSDQQEAVLGEELAEDAPLRRGDLVFWKGHVGIMSSESMLLHANAHHMAVAYEPLEEAEARIKASGGGPITSRRHVLID